MIINSESVKWIRENAQRLARVVRSKDDLTDLATASSFEQVFSAIESLLANTEMFFDDEVLSLLNENTWQGFKASLLVYTLNIVNKKISLSNESSVSAYAERSFGASY